MDSDYVQLIRYKLQKRLRRLNTNELNGIHWALVQTWAFLQENEITKGILDDLERRVPEAEKDGEAIVGGEEPLVGTTETGHVAISYWVLKKCLASGKTDYAMQIGRRFGSGELPDHIELFRENYIEPLFNYIDEQIDDKRMTLMLLRKYKHRCEWFRREELLAKCREDTLRGEHMLAYNLYEYLHDQGIEFHIEPQSASGRVDLISAQSGKDCLIADAKIFNPDRGQNVSYIGKGFRQLYDYTRTYHEPFGFLVIFKTCEHDLSIQTNHQEQATPFFTHNNKTIFFLVIDLFEYTEPASKRGKLKTHEITPQQLIAFIAPADMPAPGV